MPTDKPIFAHSDNRPHPYPDDKVANSNDKILNDILTTKVEQSQLLLTRGLTRPAPFTKELRLESPDKKSVTSLAKPQMGGKAKQANIGVEESLKKQQQNQQEEAEPPALPPDQDKTKKFASFEEYQTVSRANMTRRVTEELKEYGREGFKNRVIAAIGKTSSLTTLAEFYHLLNNKELTGLHQRSSFQSGFFYFFRTHETTRTWHDILDAIKIKMMLIALASEDPHYSIQELNNKFSNIIDHHRKHHIGLFKIFLTSMRLLINRILQKPRQPNLIENVRAHYIAKSKKYWATPYYQPAETETSKKSTFTSQISSSFL